MSWAHSASTWKTSSSSHVQPTKRFISSSLNWQLQIIGMCICVRSNHSCKSFSSNFMFPPVYFKPGINLAMLLTVCTVIMPLCISFRKTNFKYIIDGQKVAIPFLRYPYLIICIAFIYFRVGFHLQE